MPTRRGPYDALLDRRHLSRPHLLNGRLLEDGAVVVFEVDSLAGAEDHVLAAGGRVLSRRDMGAHGKVVTFSDPEGNIAQLFCRS